MQWNIDLHSLIKCLFDKQIKPNLCSLINVLFQLENPLVSDIWIFHADLSKVNILFYDHQDRHQLIDTSSNQILYLKFLVVLSSEYFCAFTFAFYFELMIDAIGLCISLPSS